MSAKFCPRCQMTKTIDNFCKHKNRSDGLQSFCKMCHALIKEKYEERPHVQQKRRIRKQLYRKTIKGRLATAKCNSHRRNIRSDFKLIQNDWIKILEIFSYRCAYCQSDKQLTLDHYLPVCFDFPTNTTNCLPACVKCNSSKRNKLIWVEWQPTNFNWDSFYEYANYFNLTNIIHGIRYLIDLSTWKRFVDYKVIGQNL